MGLLSTCVRMSREDIVLLVEMIRDQVSLHELILCVSEVVDEFISDHSDVSRVSHLEQQVTESVGVT